MNRTPSARCFARVLFFANYVYQYRADGVTPEPSHLRGSS